MRERRHCGLNALLRDNRGYHRRDVRDTIFVEGLRKYITIHTRYCKQPIGTPLWCEYDGRREWHGMRLSIDVSVSPPRRSEEEERRLWRESSEGMAEEALLASFCF